MTQQVTQNQGFTTDGMSKGGGSRPTTEPRVFEDAGAFRERATELRTAGPTADPLTEAAFSFGFLVDTLRSTAPISAGRLTRQMSPLSPVLTSRLQELGQKAHYDGDIHIPRVVPPLYTNELANWILREPVPFVLHRYARQTSAVQRWTPDYLGEHYGQYELPLAEGKDQRLKGKIADVVADIRSGRPRGLYIHNVANLFNDHPELEQQLELDPLVSVAGQCRTMGLQLFMGGAQTGTSWHCASGMNWFIQVHGRKRWYMSHPKVSPWIYAKMHKSGSFCGSPVPHEGQREQILADYPLYEHVPVFYTDLEPGDVLYVPPWWWHAITNLSDSTIAVATRWQTMQGGLPEGNLLFRLAQQQCPNMRKFDDEVAADADFRIRDEFIRDTYDEGITSAV
jgi:hypothetical protein